MRGPHAVIVALVCAMAFCGCVPVDDVDAAMLPDETEHATGMPLDAIEYDPPAWMSGCYEAYRIYDRTNGQQWWVLVMQNGKYDANYVVLPIGGQYDAT